MAPSKFSVSVRGHQSASPTHTATSAVASSTAKSASGTLRLCRMHSDPRTEYAVPDLLATSPIPGSDRLRWRYWPRYNETRDVFEELVTEENRWSPTFLDFSYQERRSLQVICMFCDSREELCLSS